MRKWKQRLCSLLLCAALAVSLCPAALAENGEGGTISDGTEEAAILSVFGEDNVTVDIGDKKITLTQNATVAKSVTFDSGSVSFDMPDRDAEVTFTAVYETSETPEGGLCLNDGGINIFEENGCVVAEQNNVQYIVTDGEIRITGNGNSTSNTD